MKNKIVSIKTNTKVIDGLTQLLADTYILYVKTQNFHWNVTGANFYPYHKMFEEQYEALSAGIDEIAERIRALKSRTPASLSQFLKLTSLEEADNDLEAHEMVQELMRDHERIGKSFTTLFKLAQECNDEVTLDLFIERKTEHDKFAWMLRSSLGLI